MSKVIVGLLAAVAIVLTGNIAVRLAHSSASSRLSHQIRPTGVSEATPQIASPIDAPNLEITIPKPSVLTIEAANTVVLRGPVEPGSVSKLINELREKSAKLPKSATIYLVLNTPGGSVFDGADLIDFIAGIPQQVKTVTIFAASMGFQIVENNPGERLITRNGILMSHRAAMSGLRGQFDGELESEYRMMKREIDFMEFKDAKRLGMTIPEYKAKIKDEWWVHGFDATASKVADEMILLQCGKSMTGDVTTTVETMFGPATVVFDLCPLISEPKSVSVGSVLPNRQEDVLRLLHEAYNSPKDFIQDYLKTGTFYTFFK
jgi:ATP-dependent protease ClpP protease subunit